MYPAHRLLLLVRGRNRIKSESLGGAGDLHSLTRLNFTVDQSATQKRKTRGESGNPKSWREGGPKKDSRILLVPPLSCFFVALNISTSVDSSTYGATLIRITWIFVVSVCPSNYLLFFCLSYYSLESRRGTSSGRIGLVISGPANCLIFLSCDHGRGKIQRRYQGSSG